MTPRARARKPAFVVLDTEAVQALADPHHAKHRAAIAIIQVVEERHRRTPGRPTLVVPVAVRVEAGWDRTHRSSANLNRLTRARDWVLDAAGADQSARLRSADPDLSVVDATIAQAARALDGPVTIVSSDRSDMTRVAASAGSDTRVAQL